MAIDRITKQASISQDALLVTTYADDYTVRGNHFLWNKRQTLTGSEVQTYLLDMTDADEAGKIFFVQPFSLVSESTKVTIKLFEGATVSEKGTEVEDEVYNINRTSDIEPLTVLYSEPTVTDYGTELRDHVAFGSSQGVNASPGVADAININILDTSKLYIIEITNEESSATDTESNVSFFEI